MTTMMKGFIAVVFAIFRLQTSRELYPCHSEGLKEMRRAHHAGFVIMKSGGERSEIIGMRTGMRGEEIES